MWLSILCYLFSVLDKFLQAVQDDGVHLFLESVANDKVPHKHLQALLSLFSFSDNDVTFLAGRHDHAESSDYLSLWGCAGCYRLVCLCVVACDRALFGGVHGAPEAPLPLDLLPFELPLGILFLLPDHIDAHFINLEVDGLFD